FPAQPLTSFPYTTLFRSPLLREQAVLYREQARGGATAGADLGVDVLDVIARGLRRHDQLAGYLPGRHAAGSQPQHFYTKIGPGRDRKGTRSNSSHGSISY